MARLGSLLGLAGELGEIRPIDQVDFLADDPRALELYRLAGLEHHAASDLRSVDLARASVQKTLDLAGVAPGEIDFLLYLGESHERDEVVQADEVNELLRATGLTAAYPIGLALSQCANLVTGLRVASSLLLSGAARRVMVVSVDKAPKRPGGRRMRPEMSVRSDSAVSCLVVPPGAGAFDLLGIVQENAPEQRQLAEAARPGDLQMEMGKFRNVRTVAKRLLAQTGLEPARFRRVITNNYNREIARTFVGLSGFPAELGFYDNIPRLAHAVAGDLLINLRDLADSGGLEPGDHVFLLTDSISSTSAFCVEALL
ncbi:MAG TPA: hypothetical protein DD490_28920 [Acidobacteria bacterium]|nr:hypothetical protein [Acidobacteriota bacterium]